MQEDISFVDTTGHCYLVTIKIGWQRRMEQQTGTEQSNSVGSSSPVMRTYKCPYCPGDEGCAACKDGYISVEDQMCDCCGYEGVELEAYAGASGQERRGFLLCEVCAHTPVSSAVIYRSQCADPKTLQSLGWIANKILEEVRRGHGRA